MAPNIHGGGYSHHCFKTRLCREIASGAALIGGRQICPARGRALSTRDAQDFCAEAGQFYIAGKENGRAGVLTDMKTDHGHFYRTRAEEERALASAASTPNVRDRHLRAAEVWDGLAERDAMVKAAKASRAADSIEQPAARKSRSRVSRVPRAE